MASSGVWIASSSVSNATGSWPQEALNSSTESFKPISKWRILRSVFNCTRIWRDVGRQAQNLRVCYTLDLQFRSIEVNIDSATSKPSAADSTLPMNVSSTIVRDSLEDTKEFDKPRHGYKKSCISQDFIFFGHVLSPQQNYAQPILAVEAFVVTVMFLSLKCDEYPTDHVDWGDWGTSYLCGTPLESNNTCVSIVSLFQAASILLFQAAYFWLKFREALISSGRKRKSSDLQGVVCDELDVHQSLRGVYACKRKSSETQGLQCGDTSDLVEGVYVRAVRDKSGTVTHYKYEPRFKPARERMDSGVTLKFNCLSLGQYNTPAEAKIVRQIAAFYYGKDDDRVELEDGFHFSIPPMSEHERGLSGEEKRKWVTWKAKKVNTHLQKEKEKLKKLRRASMTGAHFGQGTDADSDPSPSASAVTYSSPASNDSADELALSHVIPFPQGFLSSTLVQLAPSHRGNLAEQPIPDTERFSGVFSGNYHGLQFNVMENDAPALDDHGKTAGYTDDCSETISSLELDMIDELIGGSASIPSYQPSSLDNQMHHLGVTEIPGDPTLPQYHGIIQGFESIEPQLRPDLSFHHGCDLVRSSLIFRQRDSALLQLVNRQKKQLEDAAIRNLDLQHRLSQSEIQNSELQQEIKRLKAMLQQVAIISSCNRVWNHI